MGKATLKKAGTVTTQTVGTHKLVHQVEEPMFSSGDLGQLQEILFGQQQRSTHEQMSELQRQFNEQLNSLGNVLNSRLNQLTETVEKYQIDFDNQLKEIKTNNESTFRSINQSVGKTKAELQTELNALSKSSNEDSKRINQDFVQHETKLLSEINNTKRELQNGIQSSIDGLQSTKIDKQDFAQLLSDISNKLTDAVTIPEK